jgi:hypothetical protein
MYLHHRSSEGPSASKRRWLHVTDKVTELLTEANA